MIKTPIYFAVITVLLMFLCFDVYAISVMKTSENGNIAFQCNMCGNRGQVIVSKIDEDFKAVFDFSNSQDSYLIRITETLKPGRYMYQFTDNKRNKENGEFLIYPNATTTIVFFENHNKTTTSPNNVDDPVFVNPDEILIGNRKLPKVLLVGTFHFGYPNLDAHNIAKEDQMDILSIEKQKEVIELVEYIAKFKPTKIVVESGSNTGYLVKKYKRWLNGEQKLRDEEIDQLAFRLMKRFELDTLYGCDASSVVHKMENSADSLIFNAFFDQIFEEYDWQNDEPIYERYMAFYDYYTKMSTRTDLLSYFKYLNNDHVLDRGYGAYLVGDFKLDEYKGADALSLYWYNRNLRIFRKIQQIDTAADDRVLVLFGAGHIQILKQLFECSPEYELIKFSEMD